MAIVDIAIIVKVVSPPIVTATSVSGAFLDIWILNIFHHVWLLQMFLVHFVDVLRTWNLGQVKSFSG